MNFSRWLFFHAVVAVAFGIALILYSPLVMALTGLTTASGDPITYWLVASFARLFGASLFGYGLLLVAIKRILDLKPSADRVDQGLLYALIIGNLVCAIVSVSQVMSVWGMLAGWITVGLFSILTIGYIYILATHEKR